MAESARHITIQRGKTLPQFQRCKSCCHYYHCPFCAASVFKPTTMNKLKIHLQSHYGKAFVHGDFLIHRCGLGCRASLHYHCVYCASTVLRRDDFTNHLQVCKCKPIPTSAIEMPLTTRPTVTYLVVKEIPSTSIAKITASTINESLPTNCTTVTASMANESPSTTDTTLTTPAINESLFTIDASVIASTINKSLPTTSATKTAVAIFKREAKTTTTSSSTKVSLGRVRVRPVIKRRCPICNTLMNRHNLQTHIDRRHTEQQIKDINAKFHLTSQCIDKSNGIFTVLKVSKGHSIPLHVQYKTWGDNHRVVCESNECQVNMEVAQSSLLSYQCKHIRSVTYCMSSAGQVTLEEEILTEMVKTVRFSEINKNACLARQRLANSSCMPLSVQTTIGVPQTKKYISVFEPNGSHYCRLGRVMVAYNTKSNIWHCPCAKVRCSCVHKHVAQWHLFQTHRKLFSTVFNMEESVLKEHKYAYRGEECITDDNTAYPPEGLELENMVNYIFQNKKIPAGLPDNIRVPSTDKDYPRHLFPHEIECQRCPGTALLSDPMLITQKAKILANWRIIEDVATYCKRCLQCGMFYRYQEWKDCLHNFNDHIILDTPLCFTLRNLLQVHTSMSRAVDFLQLMTGVEFPLPDTMLHAYLHFEALTDHEYKYSCASCGDHPPVVLVAGFQGGFQLSVSDIEESPENFKGQVNLEKFWEAVSKELIGRGFVASDGHNPFAVPPTFHFWAPWIGKSTRCSDTVLNTEFEKVSRSASEISETSASEERLREKLFKQKVDVIRTLCKECGLDSTGSHSDLLHRLSKEMKSRQTYDKIYEKIWATSGGWGVVMCPCGIVYSLKCNLHADSPRDFADLLLSWRHMPNVIIYDFAQGLATHINLRAPEKVLISPFEGCLLEPTQANIELAQSGMLAVSLPWLDAKKTVADLHGHPVTGSSDHYVLYDPFHESKTEDSGDVLRKLTLVPQLAGKVNGQAAEQLLDKMKKNSYFLNMSSPSTHLFQTRNIIHHYNEYKNKSRTVWISCDGEDD
ncbi:uncharacterized protein LOC127617185 isoform X1 [Xyrauchen texanus]|uniref:uncharacterized protein LOC127617185 isoform X1 n=1 Tax=Xyrauchen texanus TaxID=154827 RepID=UPI0022424940|nr:uncharacterized protein LOC127617185 isoform X1 [Xyrauchen texanus]